MAGRNDNQPVMETRQARIAGWGETPQPTANSGAPTTQRNLAIIRKRSCNYGAARYTTGNRMEGAF